jgi:hypothetical protein
MKKPVITPEIAVYIGAQYLVLSSRKIGENCKISKTAVLVYMKKIGLIVPEEIRKTRKKVSRKKPYTTKEHNYIVNNIQNKSIKELAKILKRCSSTLLQEAHRLGLTDVIEQKKRSSRIQPGTAPPNKGKKIHEYMNATQIEVFKSNQFKTGSTPHNALPDGSEVQRVDKSGKIYTLVKVPGERKLVLKHRFVWERFHNKKVPYRHKITFKDGTTNNFAIDNLECISYEAQMLQNSLHNYPEELKELIFIKGAITRQINKKTQPNESI